MQFLAAKSLCTNRCEAKYSIPRHACKPNPIKSLTVGLKQKNEVDKREKAAAVESATWTLQQIVSAVGNVKQNQDQQPPKTE